MNSMELENELTEGQKLFFDEKKQRLGNLPEDATEREKELAKTAMFMTRYAEDLQKELNRVNAECTAERERIEVMERMAAVERHKNSIDFSKAWGAMVACYRAIDRHFGNEIRAHLDKNDRTQKEGQMRALMEQIKRLAK